MVSVVSVYNKVYAVLVPFGYAAEIMTSIEKALVMIQNIPVNADGFCRLCGRNNLKLINFKEEQQNDLLYKIEKHIPIKLMECGGLSPECCMECVTIILSWHDFVLRVLETNKRVSRTLYTKLTTVSSSDCSTNGNKPGSTTTNLLAFCQNSENNIPEQNSLELQSENDNKGKEINSMQHSFKFSDESEEETKNIQCKKGNIPRISFSHAEDGKKKISDRLRRVCTKLDPKVIQKAKVVIGDRTYYNCENCGKSLLSPYTFVWHMRIHTGERPFMCDLCGKLFRVSQGLVRHLKETHKRIKNFSCDLCGRMFATKRNVEEHRRIHTNERPYVCALCKKSFKQKASLFVHNRIHSNNFPFKCEYCSQAFHSKPPLLIHITKHTGQKPYPCDICGRRFRIKYELKRHKLVHSEEKPFVCSICGLKFKQKRYLRNHFKTNHTDST